MTAELKSMNRVALSGAITLGGQFPVPPASDAPPFGVFMFVPEIEAVFFEAPQALERLLGRKLAREQAREGLLIPRRTLSDLLENAKAQRDYQSLLAKMDPQGERALASGRQAKSLMQTVESMLATPADV